MTDTNIDDTHDNQTLTFEELAREQRRRGREMAAQSVRRIQRDGARRLVALKARQAGELAALQGNRAIGFRSVFLCVGACVATALAVIGHSAMVPTLGGDASGQGLTSAWRDFESDHAPVRVAMAEAEPQLGFTVTGPTQPAPSPRRPAVAPTRPKPSTSCTGDPNDPMNFCL